MNPELEKNVAAFLNHAASFGEYLGELQALTKRGVGYSKYKVQMKAEWHLVRARNALERIYRNYRSTDMSELPERAVRRMGDGLDRMEEKYKRLTTNIY